MRAAEHHIAHRFRQVLGLFQKNPDGLIQDLSDDGGVDSGAAFQHGREEVGLHLLMTPGARQKRYKEDQYRSRIQVPFLVASCIKLAGQIPVCFELLPR